MVTVHVMISIEVVTCYDNFKEADKRNWIQGMIDGICLIKNFDRLCKNKKQQLSKLKQLS